MRENIFLSCILVTFCVGLLISFSASWGYMKIISAETYQDSSVKSTNSREHVISSLLVYLSPNLTQSLEYYDRIKNSHVKFDIHYKSKTKCNFRSEITCATYSVLPKYGTTTVYFTSITWVSKKGFPTDLWGFTQRFSQKVSEWPYYRILGKNGSTCR